MANYPDYSAHRPGLAIEQKLLVEGISASSAIPSCLVGPAALLSRYGKEDPTQFLFSGSEQVMPWSYKLNGADTELPSLQYAIDLATATLFGKNLEASLATFTAAGSPSFTVLSLAEPHVLKLSAGSVAGTGLATAFRGRSTRVGDIVLARGENNGTLYRRQVVGLRGVVAAGSYGSNDDGDNSVIGNVSQNPISSSASATAITAPANWTIGCASPGAFKGLARGARYLTEYGELFTITVHTPGVAGTGKVNITSASGRYSATNVATVDASGNFSITDANANGELGGVTLLITPPSAPNNALVAGQVFKIKIVGTYARLTSTNVILAGTYTGEADTTYFIEVVTTNTDGTDFDGAVVRVTDSAGIDTPGSNITITDGTAYPLGSLGLTLEFDGVMPSQGGLRVGDRYYVHAKAGAVSTTAFDKIVLNGPAVDTNTFTNPATELYNVELRLAYTGEITRNAADIGNAWTSDAEALTVAAGLQIEVPERDANYEWCSCASDVGYLIPSFRAFKAAGASEGLISISSAAEITSKLGTVDLDNPLAYAAQQALLGSQGTTVYCVNTGGASVDNFTSALNRIANIRTPYDITLLCSPNSAIWAAGKAHVLTASAPLKRYMRRLRVAADSPGRYPVLSTRANTTNFTATVSPQGSGNLLVTIVAGASEALLESRGLVIGDLIKFPDLGVEYPIASVVSDTEVLLQYGPDSPIVVAESVQVWKEDTVASQKAYLISLAESLRDRRISLVWCDRPLGLDGATLRQIPVMYGAAFVSGVRSYVAPQIGITRQAVTTFTAAPRMYTVWDQTDLDELAAAGIQIITQEAEDGAVRIRHQVTTSVTQGILAFEESVTVRMDAVTNRLDAVLDSLIGPTNTTERSAMVVRERLVAELGSMKLTNAGDTDGPLIDDYKDLQVELPSTLLDRINASVLCGFGPPTNRIYLRVTGTSRITPTTT